MGFNDDSTVLINQVKSLVANSVSSYYKSKTEITVSGNYTARYSGVHIIICVGGGGGGSAGNGHGTGGSGGGSGATYEIVQLTKDEIVAITIGAGGAGSVSTAGAGGTTSFGAYLSAIGAGGGTNTAGGLGTNGGGNGVGNVNGTGGDYNRPQELSNILLSPVGSTYYGGIESTTAYTPAGGGAGYGGDGGDGNTDTTGGKVGQGYGAGGGAGSYEAGANRPGGNGADGVCIVLEVQGV